MPKTKEQRQKTAKMLLEQRAQRSAQEQIELLDKKFGIGQGAKKERARLQKILSAEMLWELPKNFWKLHENM